MEDNIPRGSGHTPADQNAKSNSRDSDVESSHSKSKSKASHNIDQERYLFPSLLSSGFGKAYLTSMPSLGDLVPYVKLEEKHTSTPAALIVVERWGVPILGGIPVALYLLINLLKSLGLVVYCTVLEAAGYTQREAARLGIHLVLPKLKRHYKTSTPTSVWLEGHRAFYPHLEKLSNLTFIFGFGLVTSSVASDIKETIFDKAKFGVINVWCPSTITKETLDYDEETFENRCTLLDNENLSADIILSIGPMVFDHFKFRYQDPDLKHYQLLPRPCEIYFDLPLPTKDLLPDEIRHFEVLSMFEKTVINELSHNDVLQEAMNLMASSYDGVDDDPPKWTILCTEKSSDRLIRSHLDPHSNLNVCVKRLKSTDYIHELRYAHIFIVPHRSVDLFSLTIAAMACGKPVIVPAMSECDIFIRKHFPTYRDRMVVDMRRGPQPLRERIVHILQHYTVYMKAASEVRSILQEKVAKKIGEMNDALVNEVTVHLQPLQASTIPCHRDTSLSDVGIDSLATRASRNSNVANQIRDVGTLSLQISPSCGNAMNGASMSDVEDAFYREMQHRPENLSQFMSDIHDDIVIEKVEKGCLRYVMKCGSLEALEAIWSEYINERLDKAIHSTILTPVLLSKIQAHYLALDIYIPVQEYLLCRREIPLLTGSVTVPSRRHSIGAMYEPTAVPRGRIAQNGTVDTLNLVLSRMQIHDSHPHSTLFSREDFRVEELHYYKSTFAKTHGKVTTDVYVQEARLMAYLSKRDKLVRRFRVKTTRIEKTENATKSDFIQLKIGTTKYSRQKKVELRKDKEVLTLFKLKGELGRVTEGHPVKGSVLEVFGSGSMPRQFDVARGIYIKKNGQWVICDWRNRRVQVIDPIKLCCDLILQFHAFPESFNPWNITVDEDNDQYFMSDPGNGQVVVSSGQSKILNCFGRKEGISPTSICLSPDGFIFIGDNEGYVRKYNKSGEHIARTKKGQVSEPYDLIVNKKCIFVSDSGRKCVHVLNHQMQSIRDIGKGHFEWPYGLCFDQQQDGIYVCDRSRNEVVHFNCDGEFLSYKGQYQLEYPRYIALCKDNPYRLVVTQDDSVKLLYI
ncbi:uncharacterized protein [Ptychodera flava]|uniref:uncharacterized protein n=1 Tax=Ptychodera flava TaxID=63121 RepID=UPI00396A62CD